MSYPLYIITTAFHAETYIARYLKSLTNELRFLTNETHVYVAIDNCKKTLAEVLLWKKENQNDQITFFYSQKNVGTYTLKNSLLKQIPHEECFVHFFDVDDLYVPKYLQAHYQSAEKLLLEHGPEFILSSILISVDESLLTRICMSKNKMNIRKHILESLISKQKYEEALIFLINTFYNTPDIVNDSTIFDAEEIQNMLNKEMQRFIQSSSEQDPLTKLVTENIYSAQNPLCTTITNILTLYAITSKDRRFIQKKQFFPGGTCGVFTTTLACMKKLGLFNRYRVNQDFDLSVRAEKMGIYSITDYTLPFFIRSLSETSLTQTKETGNRSAYREKIRQINRNLIARNHLKAKGISCPLTRI